ncbi:MAG: hypothetical protein QOI23_2752 [Chloroflexota bacterium]|nr:hypothetical protein [Chloroflexota bacterium]
MGELPPDFADMLARIVEPAHQADVAGIIESATQLDDDGLRKFLQKFADRVRASAAPLTREELHSLLEESK